MSVLTTSSAIRLDRSCNGRILSPDEFDEVGDWDDRFVYELVHQVVVNPIPLASGMDPNDELGYWLRRYQQTHPQGAALNATMPERHVRTANSRRKADRVIWAGLGRLPDPRTVIDRFQQQMTVCRRGRPDRIFGERETYTREVLPGFELPPGRLLQASDQWREVLRGGERGHDEDS